MFICIKVWDPFYSNLVMILEPTLYTVYLQDISLKMIMLHYLSRSRHLRAVLMLSHSTCAPLLNNQIVPVLSKPPRWLMCCRYAQVGVLPISLERGTFLWRYMCSEVWYLKTLRIFEQKRNTAQQIAYYTRESDWHSHPSHPHRGLGYINAWQNSSNQAGVREPATCWKLNFNRVLAAVPTPPPPPPAS